MAYIAPIIGYIDNLGYLRCVACANETQHQVVPIYRNNHFVDFGSDDICDRCGKKLTSQIMEK